MSIESLDTTSMSGSCYDDDGERNSTTSSTITNNTRRLTNVKVRAIFECLYNSHVVPPMPFTIVPVNSNGKALSPPSYEFEYGLYILLRPSKGGKNKANDTAQQQPQAPKHLQHLVMTQYPPETCKWQLSGPQFPTPTAIQQRYCYPQGREEYSQCTGSALWTMYNSDGIENKEFRLLHVYYSTKRLHNGGVRNGKSTIDMTDIIEHHCDELNSEYTPISTSTKSPGKQRKLPKRIKATKVVDKRNQREMSQAFPTPYQGNHFHTVALSPSSLSFPPIQHHHHEQQRYPPKPVHGGLPTSPIRYGPTVAYDTTVTNGYTVSPPSPWPETTTGAGGSGVGESNMHYHNRYRPQAPFQRYYNRSMLMMESSNSDDNVHSNHHHPYQYSYNEHSPMNGSISSSTTTPPQLLPFRRQYQYDAHQRFEEYSEYEPTNVVPVNLDEKNDDPPILSSSTDETVTFSNFSHDHHDHHDHHNDDLHSIMMTPIHMNDDDEDDVDSTSLWEEVSGEKMIVYEPNDLFTRMTSYNSPSKSYHNPGATTGTKQTGVDTSGTIPLYDTVRDDDVPVQLVPVMPSRNDSTDSNTFQSSLEEVHIKLRDCIHQAPSHDQPELVLLLSSWARQLADDPLVALSPKATATVTTTTDSVHDVDGSDQQLVTVFDASIDTLTLSLSV